MFVKRQESETSFTVIFLELERSTMADWVGGSSRLLEPLVEALRRYVTAAGKLHADDTPVPAPGQGKTKTGRACGRMFAMIVLRATQGLRRCGSPTPQIAKASIPRRSGKVSWHAAGGCLCGLQSAL